MHLRVRVYLVPRTGLERAAEGQLLIALVWLVSVDWFDVNIEDMVLI
jgi:hypothetical protein